MNTEKTQQEDLIEIDESIYRDMMQKEWESLEPIAFEEVVDAMVCSKPRDPDAVWEELTYCAYDPKRVLRALVKHPRADSQIDPVLLMETFMETYDYAYANHARFAIGCIVGHKHMRGIRTRGNRYWYSTLSPGY